MNRFYWYNSLRDKQYLITLCFKNVSINETLLFITCDFWLSKIQKWIRYLEIDACIKFWSFFKYHLWKWNSLNSYVKFMLSLITTKWSYSKRRNHWLQLIRCRSLLFVKRYAGHDTNVDRKFIEGIESDPKTIRWATRTLYSMSESKGFL